MVRPAHRPTSPPPRAAARRRERRGFQPRVATESPARRAPRMRAAPSHPTPVTRRTPRVRPHHPWAAASAPATWRTRGRRRRSPPARRARRRAGPSSSQSPDRRPPTRRRKGRRTAETPTPATSAARILPPRIPMALPEGNHAVARSPRAETGTRARRRKRARARRPIARISRRCSRDSMEVTYSRTGASAAVFPSAPGRRVIRTRFPRRRAGSRGPPSRERGRRRPAGRRGPDPTPGRSPPERARHGCSGGTPRPG